MNLLVLRTGRQEDHRIMHELEEAQQKDSWSTSISCDSISSLGNSGNGIASY